MPTLEVRDEPNMHLLGLMLRTLIRRNLQRPGVAESAERRRQVIGVQAGLMQATLRWEGARIVIEKGFAADAQAYVIGTLDAFLFFQIRPKLQSIPAILGGRLKIKGNPLKLMALLPLTRL